MIYNLDERDVVTLVDLLRKNLEDLDKQMKEKENLNNCIYEVVQVSVERDLKLKAYLESKLPKKEV
jgi:hypothetical protein